MIAKLLFDLLKIQEGGFFLLLCTIYVHIPATDAVFVDLVQCVVVGAAADRAISPQYAGTVL